MRFYEELLPLRKNDVYSDDVIKKRIIKDFFPESASSLTQDLSNVTSAFYGFLLQKAGVLAGFDNVNSLSEELFYELGKLKTDQACQKMSDLPRDTRAFAIIAISAIFNASPEYIFSVEKFTSDHTIINLSGEDRYHKIASMLGFAEYLQWPTLTPFMRAINDTLNLQSEIYVDLISLNEKSETYCKYEFKK
jgi:hypothetical protein